MDAAKTLAFEESDEIPPLQPVSREKPLPVSYSQENLWLFEQLTPGTSTYTTCQSVRVLGFLSPYGVEVAFNDLLRRHESLRTRFKAIEGVPVQIINPCSYYSMPLVDLTGLSEEQREGEAFRLSNEDAQRPIDLGEAPVARTRLLRIGPTENVVVVSVHHIAHDLWSGRVALKEIESSYLAHSRGEPLQLPPLPVQYAEFAVWQRDRLRDDMFQSQLAYWKEKLSGLAATPMEIPTDRPRPGIEMMPGASQYQGFPKSLIDRISALANSESATQFMAFLAVYQVLLHRYTGQDDIAVGSVHSNRNRRELERVVGLFENPIMLRVDASGNPSFREFLGRVRSVSLEAHSNQDLPFELIVRELQPEQSANRMPLIQAGFVLLLNHPAMEPEIAGLEVVPYKLHSGRTQLDLELTFRESERGLDAEIEYNCELFDPTTISRMSRHFEILLESIVVDPDQRICDLTLLTDSERSQLLIEWNENGTAFRPDKCAHELLEEQVERSPDALAVAFEDRQLTYHELNVRANQLAHHLGSRDVSPESLVAICMERSLEMMIGLLGILKAGAAYVPLDPKYPDERLAFMLQDAQVRVLLTKSSLLPVLPEWNGEAVCLDTDWELVDLNSEHNPRTGVSPHDLAYVIYTSGSTGNPKGVMVNHQSLVSYAETAASKYEIRRSDRVLQFCSISFDISGEEIYPCLVRGAALVLRTEAMLDSIPVFLENCRKWNITFMSLPTAYWHEICASLEAGKDLELPASLRMVIIAGESALPDRLAAWRECARDRTRLINTYGPTEATISVTMCELTGPPATDNLVPEVSIGRVIPDAKVYVLDKNLGSLPMIVSGAVHIGGLLLARGYLNRPEMTAEKFVPDPFNGDGSRLYSTGDLARYVADGNLRFVGRVDHQVKIRGQRVETDEVESVINRHPSVRQNVVIAKEFSQEEKRLVAYVVSEDDGVTLSISELKNYLRERLPEHMVPHCIMQVEFLPKLTSGKINRRALPEPDWNQTNNKESYVAPRNEVELILAEIWSSLLGAENIGVHDDFFERGGHSLLATRVISRLSSTFNVTVPLRSFLEKRTIAQLAIEIEEMIIREISQTAL